jgi:hypothetical protein
MSTLETNSIGKYSGNNVSIDDALNLKSYDTAGRDALTASAGDVVYNSETGTIDFYNGTAWFSTSATTFTIPVEYLVIAGGGGGPASFGGGGGAGGYRNSYASETSGANSSTETPIQVLPDGTTYTVSIGGGGVAYASGTASSFSTVTSTGGGRGGQYSSQGTLGGSGGGGSGHADAIGGLGTANQGFDGGTANYYVNNIGAGAGGGGAGAVGGDARNPEAVNVSGGHGGDGLTSSITGSAVTRAGGGGGGVGYEGSGSVGSGGSGGGGNGAKNQANPGDGTVNTGSGGGGGGGVQSSGSQSSNGGSGVVILRWATADATIGATRTGLIDGGVQTDGTDSYIVFTGGTGTVSFS